MSNVLALFLQLTPVDECIVPEVGIEVVMRRDDVGTCVATVSYLTPERDAYYSATDLGNGLSLEGESNLTPAMQFIQGGEAVDGWVLLEETILQIQTDFAPLQFVSVNPTRCTCL
jgi:hypothetical protein